jgi:hypothetical protein
MKSSAFICGKGRTRGRSRMLEEGRKRREWVEEEVSNEAEDG